MIDICSEWRRLRWNAQLQHIFHVITYYAPIIIKNTRVSFGGDANDVTVKIYSPCVFIINYTAIILLQRHINSVYNICIPTWVYCFWRSQNERTKKKTHIVLLYYVHHNRRRLIHTPLYIYIGTRAKYTWIHIMYNNTPRYLIFSGRKGYYRLWLMVVSRRRWRKFPYLLILSFS